MKIKTVKRLIQPRKLSNESKIGRSAKAIRDQYESTFDVWRTRRMLSIAEIARDLGTPKSTVHRWSTGESTPRVEYVLKMQKLYGVRLNDLFKEA
jgi:ribosome-binding protein aMBF1 (putative translation factor)